MFGPRRNLATLFHDRTSTENELAFSVGPHEKVLAVLLKFMVNTALARLAQGCQILLSTTTSQNGIKCTK
jgi:hypothetical protein